MIVDKQKDDFSCEELAAGIFLFKNIFNPANMIDLFEQEGAKDWPYLAWELSPTGNGEVSNYRGSLQMELAPIMLQEVAENNRLYELHKLWKEAFENINKCVYQYRRIFNLELRRDEGYRVLKYPSGAEYRPHVDYHWENERQSSLVGWFNEDFEGGELVFDNLNLTVPCQAGSLVMFPSNYVYKHRANPVAENSFGIKYSFVTWFT